MGKYYLFIVLHSCSGNLVALKLPTSTLHFETGTPTNISLIQGPVGTRSRHTETGGQSMLWTPPTAKYRGHGYGSQDLNVEKVTPQAKECLTEQPGTHSTEPLATAALQRCSPVPGRLRVSQEPTDGSGGLVFGSNSRAALKCRFVQATGSFVFASLIIVYLLQKVLCMKLRTGFVSSNFRNFNICLFW